jgi:hypothetical protein
MKQEERRQSKKQKNETGQQWPGLFFWIFLFCGFEFIPVFLLSCLVFSLGIFLCVRCVLCGDNRVCILEGWRA